MYSQTNRYKIFLNSFIVVVLLSIFFVSCKSNSNNVKVEFEDGISVPIRDLIGEDLLNVLENDLGFPIYRGENPPNVEAILLSSGSSRGEATVIMKPTILEKTIVPGDAIKPGDNFWDIFIRFSNMNMEALTVDFDRIVLGSGPFLGPGSHIIGDGSKFTVFGKQEDIIEQDTVISVNFFQALLKMAGFQKQKEGLWL